MSGRHRRPALERRYGFFKCSSCNSRWESAHVFCVSGTDKVYYKQECRSCKIACNPYRLEMLKCPNCHQAVGICTCSMDDYDDERHNDPQKSHRSDLCMKCRSGWPCTRS